MLVMELEQQGLEEQQLVVILGQLLHLQKCTWTNPHRLTQRCRQVEIKLMGLFILIWQERQLHLKLVLASQLPKTKQLQFIGKPLNSAWLRQQLQPRLASIPLGDIARVVILLVDFFMLKLLCPQ